MRRDRVTFAMMLGVPLIQLLLFGFAINNDPKSLPAAIVTASHDEFSRAMVSALELTGYYRFTHVAASAAEAEELIERGEVAFVVTIPSDFGARVVRGDRPRILVEADATDPAAASGAISTLGTVAGQALLRATGAEAAAAEEAAGRLEVVVHRRYNPEGISQYNIVPGLLGVILQMTMVMMTSMALTRETERGTMENLLAMPSTPTEVMLAKVLPYLAVGAVQVTVVLLAARGLFAVPFVGRLGVLVAAVFVFVLALVLLGYAISSFARTQMQAMQLTFFFFLPSLLLSGFMFPYRGMPGWAQVLGEIFPLTHFIRAIRAVMLKGADLATISREMVALAVFVMLYALVALVRFRRTLD
jgi:ABC-2 type transport system permease protein